MKREILKTIVKDFFKLKYPLAMILFILILGASMVWAWGEDSQITGWLSPQGSTKTIPTDVYYGSGFSCTKVINTGGLGSNYFVPTKTVGEWQAFTAHLPSGIALTDCTSCTNGYKDYDKDGYGVAPSACYDPSTSYDVVQAGTDCADSFSYIFPGNTGTDLLCTYSASCAGFYANNDNGGEHNCDSSLAKALWQGPGHINYPSNSPLPTSLYYLNASGAYTAVYAGSFACGELMIPNGTSASWYTGTGGVYTVAFFGQAQGMCR